ncbi:MAG: Gfo/Idh/MocA family oxidoreductase [Oceanospirillaceae bacterium]|nr:Gfo/Idh/MocA family oxidoreductase [Oceanospirillaceae bacterium]
MQQIKQDFPPASRRLRLGFVGGGQGALIGEVHANGARLSNRWDIVAGALSSNPQRAQASGKAWMLDDDRIYSDYQDMAQKEAARADGIEAVSIVTPNHLHAPIAKAFMDVGIDIISDKPLTTSLEEAQSLAKAQARSGVVFGVTYAYSAHIMVRQAQAMVRRGDLGDIRQIHVEYFQDWAMNVTDQGENAPWRLDVAKNGPSFTVGDIGTHAEHLARFVSGLSIEAVRADFHVTGKPKALEDTAFMQLSFAGDVPGTLMVSQAMAGSQCGLRLRVCGTKASLEWHQEQPEILHLRAIGAAEQIISRGHDAGMIADTQRLLRMPRGHPEALTDAWANLYLELAVAVQARREGRALPKDLLAYPTIADGVEGMRFVEAAIVSNATDAWVFCA